MSPNNHSIENFKVIFEGPLSQVSSDTLVASLVSFSNILKEVNKEINPGLNLDININALTHGSFEVNYALAKAPNLEEDEQPLIEEDAKDVVDISTELLQIRKALGEKPLETFQPIGEDKVKITDEDGNILEVHTSAAKLYSSNAVVNESLSNQFQKIDEDTQIDGYRLEKESGEEIFHAEKQDFPNMAARVEILDETSQDITKRVILVAYKLSYEPSYQWCFYYSGEKISAYIEDEEFYQKINSGEKFAKGDRLEVKLRIHQVFDISLQAYINRSYIVETVYQHIPRDTQMEMDI